MRKTKVMLNHQVSIKENLRTGQLEAACKIEPSPTTERTTQGQFTAMAFEWALSNEAALRQLYGMYQEHLKNLEVMSAE